MSTLDSGNAAKHYATPGDFLEDIRASGEMRWGWVDGRLLQRYPGGRTVDYTQVYRKLSAWKLADETEEAHSGK